MKLKTFIHVALVTVGLRKRNISPEAEDLVRNACDLMLQYPDRYDQGRPGIPVCGSAGCICGFIQWAKHPAAKDDYDLWNWEAHYEPMSESTARLLGVPDVGPFFYWGEWPARYRTRYLEATNPIDLATVGVERMEHWLATDGLE